jgi:hypothetical protein
LVFVWVWRNLVLHDSGTFIIEKASKNIFGNQELGNLNGFRSKGLFYKATTMGFRYWKGQQSVAFQEIK